MKKGYSLDFTAVVVLIVTILVLVSVAVISAKGSITHSKNLAVEYAAANADGIMQSTIQAFEKTAIFFGVMNSEKELREHGGVSLETINSADWLSPIMKTANDVAFFAPIECDGNGVCTIRKRMPFVFNADYNMKIGTTTSTLLILNSAEHPESIADVAGGSYDFVASIRIFMLKMGSVTVRACQEDRCTPAQTFTESSTKEITISDSVVHAVSTTSAGNCPGAAGDITIRVTGSAEDIAALRTVAVSIYGNSVASDMNNVLTKNINDYRTKLMNDPNKPKGIDLSNVEAVLTSAGPGVYGTLDEKQKFSKGIVWAPDKLSVSYPPDVAVGGWGAAEEDVKTRYWLQYDAAKYLTDVWGTADLIMPRLLRAADAMADFCYPSIFNHGSKVCPGSECAPPYSSGEFRSYLNNGLKTLSDELNVAYQDRGFSWRISIPDNLLTGNDFTNTLYQSPEVVSQETHSWCCAWSENGCTRTCSHIDYTCAIGYAREFTSNGHNLKIMVEITDEKYKTFDAVANDWVNPTFKFFVEFYPVGDNYCDGYDCRSIARLPPLWQAAPALPMPVSLPNEIVCSATETCTQTAGQACEAGSSCISGTGGTGTCSAGKICCVADDLPPPITECALAEYYVPTNGCPAGKVHCSDGCSDLLPVYVCCKSAAIGEGTCAVLGGTCSISPPSPFNRCPADKPTEISKDKISDCAAIDEVCCK